MRELSEAESKNARKHLLSRITRTKNRFIEVMGPVFGVEYVFPVDIKVGTCIFDGRSAASLAYGLNLFGGITDILVSDRHEKESLSCCYDCRERWIRSLEHNFSHELSHEFHFLVNPELREEEQKDFFLVFL